MADPDPSAPRPENRIRTSLPRLVGHVVQEYGLDKHGLGKQGPAQRQGPAKHGLQQPGGSSWSVITTGYEDCNVRIDNGAFGVVVKVFAVDRPRGIAERTAGLITRVRAARVRHPRLWPDAAGQLVHEFDGHQLFVMDRAAGRTFYELGRFPAPSELEKIIAQAARIHSVDARPEPVFDPWAIANLVPLAKRVGALLSAEQRDLVRRTVDGIVALDADALPSALIHADLTAGNVLLGDDGEITILDFALANRWPRLQELAVIAASLLHGSPEPVAARMTAVADLYDARAAEPLTGAERESLHVFGRAAAAMELLGGLSQWQQGNQGAETRQLIEIGTASLRDYG
jgi:Ser/Thr protein kinase RdoA (MazF antagonist)